MDYGIALATAADSWKVVKRAEAAGYSNAGFFDTHLLNAEMFVAMGAAAVQTSKIHLTTEVMMVTNRIAPVAASGLASLNLLAPGRIGFGISTGYTGRRTMGVGPVKLDEMKEYIRVVRGLLSGAITEWEFEGRRRKMKFMSPEIGVYNIKDPIPLYVSAFGPRAQKLVAEIGANWIFTPHSVDHAKAVVGQMRAAWKANGHDPSRLRVVAEIGGCILADGEPYDSKRAKAHAGPLATIALHNWAEADEYGSIFGPVIPPLQPLVDAYKKIYQSYQPADGRYMENHRGHLMFLRPEEEALCTAELIKMITLTGTKSYLREQLQGYKEAGIDQVSFQIRNSHPEMIEEWAELFASV
jgi:5,10-methylenetetrahydromethanopterin reductase